MPFHGKNGLTFLQSERCGQPRVVSERRMHVEREVAAVNRQPAVECDRQLPKHRAVNPLGSGPEHSMVNEQEVGLRFNGLRDHRFAGIHRRGHPGDPSAAIGHLQPVESSGVVRHFGHPQFFFHGRHHIIERRAERSRPQF